MADRLSGILMHLQAAADLAQQEALEQAQDESEDVSAMAKAFRAAAHQRMSIPSMDEISLAFNTLTANLLRAGMPLHPGNEIQVRLSNAVSKAISDAFS